MKKILSVICILTIALTALCACGKNVSDKPVPGASSDDSSDVHKEDASDEDKKYAEAKEMYFQYGGNIYGMELDGVSDKFESYHVPDEIIARWKNTLLFGEDSENGLKELIVESVERAQADIFALCDGVFVELDEKVNLTDGYNGYTVKVYNKKTGLFALKILCRWRVNDGKICDYADNVVFTYVMELFSKELEGTVAFKSIDYVKSDYFWNMYAETADITDILQHCSAPVDVLFFEDNLSSSVNKNIWMAEKVNVVKEMAEKTGQKFCVHCAFFDITNEHEGMVYFDEISKHFDYGMYIDNKNHVSIAIDYLKTADFYQMTEVG